jgi:hypothetical protein
MRGSNNLMSLMMSLSRCATTSSIVPDTKELLLEALEALGGDVPHLVAELAYGAVVVAIPGVATAIIVERG